MNVYLKFLRLSLVLLIGSLLLIGCGVANDGKSISSGNANNDKICTYEKKYTEATCKKNGMTVTIYDKDCTNEDCKHNKFNRTNKELFQLIVDIQKEFKDSMGLEKHNNSLDINFNIDPNKLKNKGYYGLYYNHNTNNYKKDTIELNKYQKYSKEIWDKHIKHEYFHHYQFYYTNNNIQSFKNTENNNSKRYTAWFMEGSSDYVSNQKTNTPPIILESGLINDSEKFYRDYKNLFSDSKKLLPENRKNKKYRQWKDNPYTRSYFFEMLSHKCTKFNTTFFQSFFRKIENKKMENIEDNNHSIIGRVVKDDKSGIKAFEETLEKNCNCDFGNQFGENNKSSLASALLFYQYATADKNSIKLLTGKDANISFARAEEFKNVSLYINAKKIPAYGAYSIILKKDFWNSGKIYVLEIDTTDNFIVSLISKEGFSPKYKNQKYTKINGTKHSYSMTNSKPYKVILKKPSDYFVTFLNDSNKNINITGITFREANEEELFNLEFSKYAKKKSRKSHRRDYYCNYKKNITKNDLDYDSEDEWTVEYSLNNKKYIAVFKKNDNGFEFLADREIESNNSIKSIDNNTIHTSFNQDYYLKKDKNNKWQLILKTYKIISGVVKNDTGEVVPDVNIKFEYLVGDKEKNITTTSNNKGQYTLKLDSNIFKNNQNITYLINAYKEDYIPDSKTFKITNENNYTVNFILNLREEKENEIAIEIEPTIHHLGNGYFSGTINSQFQKNAEGTEFIKLFNIDTTQYNDYNSAEIVFQAKGIQNYQNKLILNNRTFSLENSPEDGGYGKYRLLLNKDDYHEGENQIEIRSGQQQWTGDYDDFEFSNIILIFK